MSVNGDSHIESFNDVEEEFEAVRGEVHAVKVSHGNFASEVSGHFGQIARDLSHLTRGQDEVRRLIVERTIHGEPRSTDDTGSHDLRETYHQLKSLASDPANPLTPGDVRAIVGRVTEEMRLRAEVTTWRRIKAFPAWAARKALEKGLEWAIVAGLVATVTYLWTLLHR